MKYRAERAGIKGMMNNSAAVEVTAENAKVGGGVLDRTCFHFILHRVILWSINFIR